MSFRQNLPADKFVDSFINSITGLMNRVFRTLFLFLVVVKPVCLSSLEDKQCWTSLLLKTHELGKWERATYLEFRLIEKCTEAGVYLFKEKVYRSLNDWLDVAVNFAYIRSRDGSGESFKNQYRQEFEFNPHWKIDKCLKITLRNRLEWRKIQDEGFGNSRFRQRWGMKYTLQNWGRFLFVEASNEFFYDFRHNQYNQNRLIPLEVGIRLGRKLILRPFFMLISSKDRGDWSQTQVFGLDFIVDEFP